MEGLKKPIYPYSLTHGQRRKRASEALNQPEAVREQEFQKVLKEIEEETQKYNQEIEAYNKAIG